MCCWHKQMAKAIPCCCRHVTHHCSTCVSMKAVNSNQINPGHERFVSAVSCPFVTSTVTLPGSCMLLTVPVSEFVQFRWCFPRCRHLGLSVSVLSVLTQHPGGHQDAVLRCFHSWSPGLCLGTSANTASSAGSVPVSDRRI